jgi:hypothetical protein
MKKIWKFLRQHLKEDFSLRTYAFTGGLLAALLISNYRLDFEDSVLDARTGFSKFVSYFFFYSIPYYLTVAIATYRSTTKVFTPAFVGTSMFALAVLSLDASLPFIHQLLANIDSQMYLWSYKVTVNVISVLTVMLPLFIFYRVAEKHRHGFYGLTPHKFDASPYFQMLLIMVPVLLAATLLPGFLRQYPMYKPSDAHLYLEIPEFVTALSYELAYGMDFVTVELLFRGFFVIGMMSYLGRRSVLAMAVIYCMLHFGKPAGEAISSIFGGYILGIIAYETRSIWGGIIVHVGIAWMMELISFLAKKL